MMNRFFCPTHKNISTIIQINPNSCVSLFYITDFVLFLQWISINLISLKKYLSELMEVEIELQKAKPQNNELKKDKPLANDANQQNTHTNSIEK